ncbi:MAG: hypothetical protein ACLFVM_16200, partial [Ralstonia sp.]|uniref:hypothetical protein n=1 Tax=Ralstonia sp. TaxID=54061 RepID=UPI003978B978
ARLQKFKGKSPSRARLSLLTFFGKTKKVSQPRQGMKPGMHHQQQNPPSQGGAITTAQQKSPPQHCQRNFT